jgi:hypothetical protein
MGHFGAKKMEDILAGHFFWPRMRREVERFVARSTTCQKAKSHLNPHVNRTLSTMLRVVLKKNIKMWEDCLPHIEFAYNRSLHSTTKMCPFEIVYGLLPCCNTLGVRLAFWTLVLHEPKPHLFIYEHGTYETCVYGMCLQHLLETYATYFC